MIIFFLYTFSLIKCILFTKQKPSINATPRPFTPCSLVFFYVFCLCKHRKNTLFLHIWSCTLVGVSWRNCFLATCAVCVIACWPLATTWEWNGSLTRISFAKLFRLFENQSSCPHNSGGVDDANIERIRGSWELFNSSVFACWLHASLWIYRFLSTMLIVLW